MGKIVAIYGSPRRNGNTAVLLRQAVAGARAVNADVVEVVLRDMRISPCLEIYGCKEKGRCSIQDDFQGLHDLFLESSGVMLASPIFFYAVSAHTKIMMDRCQALWVKKHWIDAVPMGQLRPRGKGLFISVGATKGRKLFDGALLTVKYFLETLDLVLWRSLLYRGLDFEGEVHRHPQYLEESYETGKEFARALFNGTKEQVG
ncbi:MAG: flavodoxin family protein [Deltaproteobacteria bacterium]|nr:flavodoxin family protein [Deltaproteobacteria bacterium]